MWWTNRRDTDRGIVQIPNLWKNVAQVNADFPEDLGMSTPLAKDSSDSETLSLEPGDRLTRDEFERRYEAMPNSL